MFTTKEELIERIERAFPHHPFSGVATTCPCDECRDLAEFVLGKRWIDLTPEDVFDIQNGSSLFTHECHAYFMPAYMRASLIDYEATNAAMDFFAWGFIPYETPIEYFKPFRTPALLTSPQREALYDWLEWYVEKEYPEEMLDEGDRKAKANVRAVVARLRLEFPARVA